MKLIQPSVRTQHLCQSDSSTGIYKTDGAAVTFITLGFLETTLWYLFHHLKLILFTVRNSSCGKVMFSQASVKNSVHGGVHSPCRHSLGRPPLDGHCRGRCAYYWNAFLFTFWLLSVRQLTGSRSSDRRSYSPRITRCTASDGRLDSTHVTRCTASDGRSDSPHVTGCKASDVRLYSHLV